MSLKVRTAVFNFWEMTAFFANSAAFPISWNKYEYFKDC